MSYTPRYDRGDWIADCDVCGRKYKASHLLQRWDGLMCCEDDWEIRQPQDFVRGVADTQIAPWLRPEPKDSFIPVTIGSLFSFLIESTVTLELFVTIRVKVKSILASVTCYSYLTSSVIPVPAPSLEALNSDALNNQALG